ncbi:MAG: peptide deformylase [Rickettsiales bacterium]|jgi:peptide deformylase|nr:peptide deformylase [Rickettsiales bacterium]
MQINRKTIEKDEVYLRQISKNVDFTSADLKQEIGRLEEFCSNTACFALAAVQIGIPKRMVYIKSTNPNIAPGDVKQDEARIIINPVVISRKGHTKFWEACLSCLNNLGLVSRPYEIILDYWDASGAKQRGVFQGFESTVLSHELDHLDGIFHMDVAEKVIQMPIDGRAAFRKDNPYTVISQDCDFENIVKQRNKTR